CVAQLRQVKGEGNLSLKPRLHRVAVGGNYIDGACAGERGHVQIGQFANQVLFAAAVTSDEQRTKNQECGHSRCCQRSKPSPTGCGPSRSGSFLMDAGLNTSAESRIGHEALPRELNRALRSQL